MSTHAAPPVESKKMLWAGYVVTALPVLMLLFSGAMKLMKPPDLVKEFDRLGYTESHALTIGIIELACTAVFVFPRTAVLGAILLTGYFGGAVATHVRIYDGLNFISPIVGGILVWSALWLRDPRIRALAPLRK